MSHQARIQNNYIATCKFCLANLPHKKDWFYKPYRRTDGIIETKLCCKNCFYGKSIDSN